MAPQDLALFICKKALSRDLSFVMFLDKVRIGPLRYKADLLGICFGYCRQVSGACDPSDLLFGQISQGHDGPLQLVLGQSAEHVGLILQRVRPFSDGKSSVFHPDNRGIVACGHIVRMHPVRKGKETFPLDQGIAENAGIGSPSGKIVFHEGKADSVCKLRHTVFYIEGNADLPGCIFGIRNLTATAFLSALRLPGLQGQTDHLIACPFQQPGGHRTVYASGHPHNDFRHLSRFPPKHIKYIKPT